MKFSLLTSVSSAAIGAGLVLASPEAAMAGLNCTSIANECTQTIAPVSNVTPPQAPAQLGSFTILDYFNAKPFTKLTSVVITEKASSIATGSQSILASTNGAANGNVTTRLFSNFTIQGGTNAPGNFPTLAFSANGRTSNALIVGQSAPNVTVHGNFGPKLTTLNTSLNGWKGATSTSSFVATLLGSGSTSTGGPSGASGSFNIKSGASLTVVYHFTTNVTTPEPASMAIVGAGLAGLGVMRRRRKTP